MPYFDKKFPHLFAYSSESERAYLAGLIETGQKYAKELNQKGFEIFENTRFNLRTARGVRREGNALMFAMLGFHQGDIDTMIKAYHDGYTKRDKEDTSSDVVSRILSMPKQLVIMVYLACERHKMSANKVVKNLRL